MGWEWAFVLAAVIGSGAYIVRRFRRHRHCGDCAALSRKGE